MNELMIIIFGLAVVRTISPLADKDNHSFASFLLAGSMIWAFYHLIANCATITFTTAP